MANLRAIRKRIRTVGSTQKITKAMKMVAAARLRRAQERATQAGPYAQKMEELLSDLLGSIPGADHPLLKARPAKNRALIVLTSDRGLCGSFNATMFRRAEIEARQEIPTVILPLGRKGIGYFSKREMETGSLSDQFWSTFSYDKAAKLASDMTKEVANGTYDRVDVLYNEFKSVITQKPKIVTLAPIAKPEGEGKGTPYLYEPERVEILKTLLPRVVEVRFYLACLHSLASEYGARMTAMDSATRNAGEMIDRLTLNMNRVRQATITSELVEIISGAEALK